MARLKKYNDKKGYYVTNTFKKQQKLYHTTYQVTNHGLSRLISKGLKNGDEIPQEIFNELLNTKQLFTNESGVNFTIDSNYKKESPTKNLLDCLTNDAVIWIASILESHPKVEVKSSKEIHENGDETINIEYKIDITIKKFSDQLLIVAKTMDGTDFFKNMNLSYNSKIKKLK